MTVNPDEAITRPPNDDNFLQQLDRLERDFQLLTTEWRPDAIGRLLPHSQTVLRRALRRGHDGLAVYLATFVARLNTLVGGYPAPAEVDCLARLLGQARQAVEHPSTLTNHVGTPRHQVFWLGSSPPDAALVDAMATYGCQLQRSDVAAALTSLRRREGALVIDLESEARGSWLRSLAEVSVQGAVRLPVVGVVGHEHQGLRIQALRAGIELLCDKPLLAHGLLHALEEAWVAPVVSEGRVLMVDDTGERAVNYAEVLQEAGMVVRVLRRAAHFLRVCREFLPDVVMISTELDGIDGLELLRLLRQENDIIQPPVILFARQFDAVLRQATVQGFCQGFLVEPVKPEMLLAVTYNALPHDPKVVRPGDIVDPLTRCLSRGALLSMLNEVEPGTEAVLPLAMIALRIGDLLAVEREAGFMIADGLLMTVVQHLRRVLQGDDLLARIHDAVFVIATRRQLPEAQLLAQRLRKVLGEVHHPTEASRFLDISVGIGLCAPPTGSVEQALQDALIACEKITQQGGKGIGLHDSLEVQERLRQRQQYWQRVLADALRQQQLHLIFQPIASLRGEPRKFYDVLLRMEGPGDLGDIPAGEFITLVENSLLIRDVDHWVIQEAIDTAARKFHGGGEVTLFLHISGKSLDDASLWAWVKNCLQKAELPGESLIFQVSRRIARERLEALNSFMTPLRSLGCRLALSEFDHYEECFHLLHRLQADVIKLDSGLMQRLRHEPELERQVRALTQRAHRQKVIVVAPNVEDAASLSLLWKSGVDYIEGFFVGAPGISLEDVASAE